MSDNQKRPQGRPKTGITPMVGVRLTSSFRTEIEAWAETQEDKPPLAEAIRRLIREALDNSKERKSSLGIAERTGTPKTREHGTAKPVRVIPPKAKPVRKATPPKKARPRRS